MRRRPSPLAFALALAACAGPAPFDPADRAAIDLLPREGSHWLAPRVVAIETTPAGAALDLFYLRDNRQVRLEHAEAPSRVELPASFDAERRDAVVIRAQLDGYLAREVQIAVRGRIDRIALDLSPAPNQLEGVALRYLGGRGWLELRTRGKPIFRTQRSERGFRIALIATTPVRALEQMLSGSARPLVEALELEQVGADLYVSAALSERGRAAAGELRFRESLDRVRGSHVLAVALAPETAAAVELDSADAVLARAPQRAVRGCALEYDRTLRDALDREPTEPGRLARLRDAIATLEAPGDRRAALQSLVAPDLAESAFTAAVERAESAERACLRADRRRRAEPR
jgi:hypothetical protein